MRCLPAAGHLSCFKLLLLDMRNRRALPLVNLPDFARSILRPVSAATTSEGYTMDCMLLPTKELLHESRETLESSSTDMERFRGSRSKTSMILATMVKSDLASSRTA
uniref:Uncharacterized protein n=1 Tax=Arundo donax TaxID=35708 RepID=A0A0A9HGS6_ARUDO